MEPLQNIKLSFKCPKQLNELQACNGDWYCDGCQKIVHDFRGMSEEQILASLVKNDYEMCGVYEAGRIEIVSQKRWIKWIPAAILTFGMSIIQSCTNNSFFPIPDNSSSAATSTFVTLGIPSPPIAFVSVRDREMQNYLYKHLSNPLKLTDTVNVRYTIDEHGSVTRVKVLNSKHKVLKAEIVKAMLASPNWMPTEINGMYVKKRFTVSLDLSQIK